MDEPKFNLTHNILNNIIKFEVEKKAIDDLELEDEVEQKIRLSANGIDIFHLAHMLGLDITLKTSQKVASGKTLSLKDDRGIYLTNFRNAMEYILSTQTSYYPVQGNVLVHLNKILIKNVAEEWDAKFRTSGEQIDGKNDNWTNLRDEEIPSVEVQSRALKILEWFTSNTTKVHAFVRIPVVLYNLIRIFPFAKANKLTLLATTKFLFFKAGCSVNGFLPVLKMFDTNEDEYQEAWKQARESGDDLTLWIERFCRNCAGEILSLRENINKIQEEYNEKNKQPFLNLNRRQLKILRYLQNIPEIQREEYVETMDVSTMTAYRDLNELVKKGLLRVDGQGRGTRYMLVSR